MNTIGLIVIGLAIVGSLCLLIALGQMWSASGNTQEPVGPWTKPRTPAPPPPPIPRDLSSLIWGETLGWQRPEQWDVLAHRLDELEIQLGGSPATTPRPADYSIFWLDQRLDRLEELAGPMPAPMPPNDPTLPTPGWKKKP